MTAENKFRNQMTEWKKLEGEAEKKKFLQKVKAEIDGQDKDGLLDGMKALNILTKELHDQVIESPEKGVERLVVSPASEEETKLLQNMLKKMNIKFEEVKAA